MAQPEYIAPVQIVVNTEQLLAQIGWRTTGYDYEGEAYEQTGPVDLRRDLATEVAKILAGELKAEMKSAVRDAVTEVARDRAATIVDEVLTSGFRKTNHYGEAVGDPITLRELLVAEVEKQLQRPVDENGRTPDGYNRAKLSYIDYVAQTAAKAALRGELGAATTAAVDEVKAKVKEIAAEQLGAQIVKAVTR